MGDGSGAGFSRVPFPESQSTDTGLEVAAALVGEVVVAGGAEGDSGAADGVAVGMAVALAICTGSVGSEDEVPVEHPATIGSAIPSSTEIAVLPMAAE